MITFAEARLNIGREVCRNGVSIGKIYCVNDDHNQIIIMLNDSGKKVFGIGATAYWAEEKCIDFVGMGKEEIKKIIIALEL